MRIWAVAAEPGTAGPARMFAPDGSFEFRNVPPGEHVIQATMGRSNMDVSGEGVLS
jgi:hypothetical protein